MGTPASWIAVQGIPLSFCLSCVSEESESNSPQFTVGGLNENRFNPALVSFNGVVGVTGDEGAEDEDGKGGLDGRGIKDWRSSDGLDIRG